MITFHVSQPWPMDAPLEYHTTKKRVSKEKTGVQLKKKSINLIIYFCNVTVSTVSLMLIFQGCCFFQQLKINHLLRITSIIYM